MTLDHPLCNVKEQTPVNIFLNKLLHLSHCVHRSWQTHSLYVTGSACVLLFTLVDFGNKLFGKLNSLDWIVLRLVVIGIITGIASHLILDAFSMAGIWIIPGIKLRFVPHSELFKTGGTWETIVFYILIFAIILCILNIFCSLFGINLVSVLQNIIKR